MTPINSYQFNPIRREAIMSHFVRILGILGLLLAGCGQQAPVTRETATVTPVLTPILESSATLQPTAALTPTLPATMQVHASDLRGLKISFWQPMLGEMAKEFTRMANEFNHQNEWGIQVNVNTVGGSGAMVDLLPEAVGKPDGPQVVLATSEQLAAWRQEAYVIGLGDYISHPDWGLSQKEIANFSPVFWQQDHLMEEQIGIPTLRTVYGLFYNQTWAKELGFPLPPLTTEQFSEQSCAAAKENNQSNTVDKHGTGGWLISTEPLSTISWMSAFGAKNMIPQSGMPYTFNGVETQKAFAFLNRLQAQGCIWDGRNPSPYEYFADRYALFYTGSLQDIAPQTGVMNQVGTSDEWTFIPYPGEKGKPAVVAGGFSYGIVHSDLPHQMAGWLFVRWLSQPDQQVRLAGLYPSLPVSQAAQTALDAKKADFPWNIILSLEPDAQAAPSLASWRKARNLVEDATWQLFHLAKKEQLAQVLPQLDEALKELVQP
jgi:multiple sugar transport system substrate-binding protein